MSSGLVTSVLDLRSEMHRPILLVGDQAELWNMLPNLRDELSACAQLQICGDLPSSDPPPNSGIASQPASLNACG